MTRVAGFTSQFEGFMQNADYAAATECALAHTEMSVEERSAAVMSLLFMALAEVDPELFPDQTEESKELAKKMFTYAETIQKTGEVNALALDLLKEAKRELS